MCLVQPRKKHKNKMHNDLPFSCYHNYLVSPSAQFSIRKDVPIYYFLPFFVSMQMTQMRKRPKMEKRKAPSHIALVIITRLQIRLPLRFNCSNVMVHVRSQMVYPLKINWMFSPWQNPSRNATKARFDHEFNRFSSAHRLPKPHAGV